MTTMSKACLPPIQPTSTATEKAHPRYAEYRNYVAACSCQLITAESFDLWLKTRERDEWQAKNWEETVFKTLPKAHGPFVPNRWYKHIFAPGHQLVERRGPFNTQSEAEAA